MTTCWIESRGDTEDALWDGSGEEFDTFYDGLSALHEAVARDLHADWAPERRLAMHHDSTGRTKYYKVTYTEVPA